MIIIGYPPFYDENDQNALFRKIKQGSYEFHKDYWSHISDEAKDLIRGLLTVDVRDRLTVDQALQHPWILRSASELATRNIDASLAEFKKFIAHRRFKAAANAVIAIRRMSRSFNHLSRENSSNKDLNLAMNTNADLPSEKAVALLDLNSEDDDNAMNNNNGANTQQNGVEHVNMSIAPVVEKMNTRPPEFVPTNSYH